MSNFREAARSDGSQTIAPGGFSCLRYGRGDLFHARTPDNSGNFFGSKHFFPDC
ncbi:hypothetical protein [Nocardia grenadensis]|uniref:hypothetical protein n=1 Tax=Nocardia grenadensis TaxID=931537 RepID=UPI003D8F4B1B